jgi:glycosyltransferase involved in cell wall biosynthesis
VRVVRYGLDELPAAWGANSEAGVPDGARILLAAGRLTEQKGFDVALRALPAIRERHPDAVLLVLGDGPLRGRLAADGAFFPGKAGDVAAWLRRAELFLHPARWEGFGLVVLEAMLAARPVVASQVSALPELVADGETGLLVPPDDPKALAAAVVRLLDDPQFAARLGAAGLARARAEFSVERMARETLAVYRSALTA